MLTVDEIFEAAPDTCPVLGITLDYTSKEGRGPQDNSPTIDRVRLDGGYTLDNVLVVSALANRIKTNASPEQIRMVADFYMQQLHGSTH